MNAAYRESMGATVDRLEAEKDDIAGVIITSAKKTFFAGGDLNDLREGAARGRREVAAGVREVKRQLRRLETLGKPGRRRDQRRRAGRRPGDRAGHATTGSSSTTPRRSSASPRCSSACCPAAAASTRTVRMLGIVDALMQLLLQGKRCKPGQGAGASASSTRSSPRARTSSRPPRRGSRPTPSASSRGTRRATRSPAARPSNPKLAQNLPAFPANLRKQLKGANYPAPHHIMAAAVEGAQVDFDNALEIEGRYFTDLVDRPGREEHDPGVLLRPAGASTASAGARRRSRRSARKKVVVLGAGMMGAAIAYVCAKAGIEVVLKDVSQEAAEQGQGLLRGARRQGRRARAAPPRRRPTRCSARITADRRPRRGRRAPTS